MKHVGSVILISVSSSHTIHPCLTTSFDNGTLQPQPPAPQKNLLALRSGESKACYSTVHALSKIVLSEAWMNKSPYNEL